MRRRLWNCDQPTIHPVRVRGGMSLRNGTWHGLRNGIIMRNIIYAQWFKENKISVSRNLAKLGRGCTAGRNFAGVSICVGGFSAFYFVFFETKNVGRRSFRWFAYHLPSAIFVYHALPQAFLPSSCLTSLKLCCAVARQSQGHLQLYIWI